MNRFLLCGLAAIAMVVGSSTSQAAFIVRNGLAGNTGTGFGNTLDLLVLQQDGSESGSVQFVGGTDLLTGDAKSQSQTQTVATLLANGVSATVDNLSVVLQVNMQGGGGTMAVADFRLRFYSAAGATLFDLTWNASDATENPNNATNQAVGPVTSPQGLGGVGTGSSGHVFNITLTAAERASFFSNTGNRIGMFVDTPITGSNDGPDNFYLLADNRGPVINPNLNPVPAPPALLLAVMGMGCMGLVRRFRKSKTVA